MLPPEAEMWTDQELDVGELNGTSWMEPDEFEGILSFSKEFASINYDFMRCIVELTVCQPAPRFFTVSGWVGWGMLTVVSLTHMVDATQCTRPSQPAHMVDAMRCTQCNRNARVLLSPRTWWMLHKHSFV